MSNTCNIFPQSPQNLEAYDVFIEENTDDVIGPEFARLEFVSEI